MLNISLTSDERYGPMLASLNALKLRHRVASAAAQDLTTAIRQTRAEKIPAGSDLTIDAEGRSPAARESLETLHRQFDAAHADMEKLEGAITHQQKLIDAEHTAASSRACATVLPEYAAVVKRLAYAALDLQLAIAAERDFRQAIESRGVAVVAPLRTPGVDLSVFGPPRSQTKLNILTERANDASQAMVAMLPAQGPEADMPVPVDVKRAGRRLAAKQSSEMVARANAR